MHSHPTFARANRLSHFADASALVADFGSTTTKIGYAGGDMPSVILPAVSTVPCMGRAAVELQRELTPPPFPTQILPIPPH